MNKKILVVIDYQNDFVNGSLGFQEAESLDSKICAKIREYGEGNVRYTMDTHDIDYLKTREGRALPIEHCIMLTPGWELYGNTKNLLQEYKAIGVCKNSFGMNYKEIETLDIPADVETIELVGLVSNICVVSNVCTLQAAFPEAQIVVDSSCCTCYDLNLHEETMDVLRGLQVEVI